MANAQAVVTVVVLIRSGDVKVERVGCSYGCRRDDRINVSPETDESQTKENVWLS